MCRCEMLDVGNFHLGKEKVTASFRSSGGGHRGQELEDRRKLRGKVQGTGWEREAAGGLETLGGPKLGRRGAPGAHFSFSIVWAAFDSSTSPPTPSGNPEFGGRCVWERVPARMGVRAPPPPRSQESSSFTRRGAGRRWEQPRRAAAAHAPGALPPRSPGRAAAPPYPHPRGKGAAFRRRPGL